MNIQTGLKIFLLCCVLVPLPAYCGFVDDVRQVVQGTGKAVEDGTNDVVNAVTGGGNKGGHPSDATINDQVKAKIGALPNQQVVSVATQDGVVSLSGTVNSQAQKDQIVSAAQSVSGVKSVDSSNLVVKQ